MKGFSQALIDKAARLFKAFSGEEPEFLDVVRKPAFPDVLMVIGECDGILYSAVRDGEVKRFIHEFRARSRPTFAVTPDGKQLILLGGAYSFTERGIVDKR